MLMTRPVRPGPAGLAQVRAPPNAPTSPTPADTANHTYVGARPSRFAPSSRAKPPLARALARVRASRALHVLGARVQEGHALDRAEHARLRRWRRVHPSRAERGRGGDGALTSASRSGAARARADSERDAREPCIPRENPGAREKHRDAARAREYREPTARENTATRRRAKTHRDATARENTATRAVARRARARAHR